MGSKAKKRSSKNPNSVLPSPPLDPPPDGNSQNPKSPPSKSPIKQEYWAPISDDSGLPSTGIHSRLRKSNPRYKDLTSAPSAEAENLKQIKSDNSRETNGFSPTRKRNPKRKVLSSGPSTDVAASHSSSKYWSENYNLMLIKSANDFREKNGFPLTSAHMPDFLTEVKKWAPGPISEDQLYNKLRHLRYKFKKCHKPSPKSSEFDRSFYELASNVWGFHKLKAGNESLRTERKVKKEEVESDEEDGDNEGGFPYEYLRHALTEFWMDKKLNFDILNAALPKVDPVQAKVLDEAYKEIFKEELKLELQRHELIVDLLSAATLP